MSTTRAWSLILAFTSLLIALSIAQSLSRYGEFRSGYSWDLAYYNQWFWAITRGDGVITVRPGAAYAFEGPSVWNMNYLAPIRVLIVPIYALFPDPRTLLVIQSVLFWCVVPAAYSLVDAESKSPALALAAAALVPLTPLTWPLAWNDFRELQLAVPFVLWAIQGWRARRRALTAFAIVGLLACRQEFALMVMSLAVLPPRQAEPAFRRRVWTRAVLAVGLGWFIAFLAYLAWRAGPHAPADYLIQFTAPKSLTATTATTALHALLAGLGSWTVLALLAPRVALLVVPWAWAVSSGQWDSQLIATQYWHHVRYAAPMMALTLAAGLIGLSRAASWCARHPRGVLALWSLAALVLAAQSVVLHRQFAQVPRRISPTEATQIWSYINEVTPDAGVFASYDVTAPLSSRRMLYSYEIEANVPPGYPRLASEIRWAFVRTDHLPAAMFLQQGFTELRSGPVIRVFRRAQ